MVKKNKINTVPKSQEDTDEILRCCNLWVPEPAAQTLQVLETTRCVAGVKKKDTVKQHVHPLFVEYSESNKKIAYFTFY